MCSLVRISFTRLAGAGSKLLNSNKDFQIVRSISSRTTRAGEDRPPKPAPYPYNEKSFTLLNYFFDKTSARMDENSKVIFAIPAVDSLIKIVYLFKILIVDGPVASGKSKFAKELAAELEMLYLPEANLDMQFINSYGFDLRSLDPLLPESCRSFDFMDFLRNPKDRRTAKFQIDQYIVR